MMYGDKWWGYLTSNNVVVITQHDPCLRSHHSQATINSAVRFVGPFTEDMADLFEGDIKMVRRKIMSALYDKPLEELLDEP